MMSDRIERLEKLAERLSGLRYDSAEAKKIMDEDDWSQIWPCCDGNGILCGGITEGTDEEVNVADMAMVEISALPQSEQKRIRRAMSDGTWDGYASGV